MPNYKPVPGQGNMLLSDADAKEAVRRLDAERKRKEEENKKKKKKYNKAPLAKQD